MIPAADISEFQGVIDPGLAADIVGQGVGHFVVRCADHLRHPPPDPRYVGNSEALLAAGATIDTYAFVRCALTDPLTAAHLYDGWARQVAEVQRLWLDVEWGTDGSLHRDTVASWLVDHVTELEAIGWAGRLGIYTNKNYWDSFVGPAADVLAHLPLWVSGYPFGEAVPPTPPEWEAWATRAASPILPRPWRDTGASYAMWQFSSSDDLIPGHRCDVNLVADGFLKDKPLPPPEEEPMTLVIPDWGRETSPGRWESYELVDGTTLVAWCGADIRDPANAGQRHPAAASGADGVVLNLEAAGLGPGPYAGPTCSPDGRLVIVKRKGAGDAAHFAFPTARTNPTPTLTVDLAEVAAAVEPVVRQGLVERLK